MLFSLIALSSNQNLYAVALITLLVVIASPLLFSWFVFMMLRKNNEVEQERQDQVYQRIEKIVKQTSEIAQLVLDSQLALDKKLDAAVAYAREQHEELDSQLVSFYALVNSDLKAARRDELIRTKELKVALERIVTLTTLARQQPDSMYILAIEAAAARIEELENILEIRL